MLTTGFLHNGPASVRYPRGTGPGAQVDPALEPLPIGKAEVIRRGERVAILAFGSMVYPCRSGAESIDATLVNMRFVKPLDNELVLGLAATHTHIVTVEENVIAGGAGSAVNELLVEHGVECRLHNIGLPDAFIEHGSREELLGECGLDAESLLTRIETLTAATPTPTLSTETLSA